MVRIHGHVVQSRDSEFVDQGHHRRQLRTTGGTDQSEYVIDLDHFLQGLKRARGDISIILEHDLNLATVDSAPGVHILLPDFQRQRMGLAQKAWRPGQRIDSTQDDLVLCYTGCRHGTNPTHRQKGSRQRPF